MESMKKWLTERNSKKNGLYFHYTPPKLVGAISAAQLRTWARSGEESKLERAVLAGQGRRLLSEAEALQLSPHLPTLIAKCDALHSAVQRGSLLDLQVLLELLEPDYNRRKYVMCRDEAGVGLLHKAVYYDFMDIAEYLVHNYPQIVHQKDSEGRTALHYAGVCRDAAGAAALLEGAGAARGARDAAGRTPAGYRGAARTLLTLPTAPTTADMARDPAKSIPGLVIKRHNIRIWCHDCDMARLQRVVWEGHGARLLSEVSNQPIVKRFLEAVPYIMNTVRDIHQAVVQNDLESVMKNSSDPVPPQILSSRDVNNMTVMHKAAGLGHSSILKYLVERYPQGINDVDNEGRTPLHYAASMRDEQHTYNLLVGLGADESIVDNKNKTPAYYINRPQEIDKTLFRNVPDAPRTASNAYPSTWDWKLLDNDVISELNKKSRKRNFKASTENLLSKHFTNTLTDSTENRTDVMKASSTHEFISDLPDLNDSAKENKDEEEKKAELDMNKESEGSNLVQENDDENDKKDENEGKAENEEIEDEHKNNGMSEDKPDEKEDIKENEIVEENSNTNIVEAHLSEDSDEIIQTAEKKEENEQEAFKQTAVDSSVDEIEVNHNKQEELAEKWNDELSTSQNTVINTEHMEPNKENIEGNLTNTVKNTDISETNIECIDKTNAAETVYNSENTVNIAEKSEYDIIEKPDHTTDISEHTTDTIKTENIKHIPETTEPNTQNSIHNTENTKHTIENVNNIEGETAILLNTPSVAVKSIEKLEQSNFRDENKKLDSAVERPKTVTKRSSATEVSNDINTQRSADRKSGKVNEISHTSSKEEIIRNEINTNKLDHDVVTNYLEKQHDKEPLNNIDDNLKNDSHVEEKILNDDANAYNSEIVLENNYDEHRDIENNSTDNFQNNRNHGSVVNSAKSRTKTPAVDVSGIISHEGNNNIEHNEDDDDVHVQGDNASEHSNVNNRSANEVRNLGSAKRGHVINGRNTQDSLIEGIISDEAELDSQDASITQSKVQREVLIVDNEIDPEVSNLINNANMEMLATLVLNGEGARLIGRSSGNAELQAFLDNVPTYMQKINKVHLAAKEGNIKDLQSSLDRRKFAIARDPISPNGATPLHVATVFGKTNIIKYLGGRFPETLSAVDFEGRTALHYAAVLPDNGHYYGILQQLGANSKDLDDNGRSAEDFFKNPSLLPFDQLLSDFGLSEEAVKSMFSDKGTSNVGNGHMDIPIFRTEEGRYLAQSLGDPLIKGLTEVANVKPKDPVAFLASFLQNFPENEKQIRTEEPNMIATEVENEALPQETITATTTETVVLPLNGARSGTRTTTRSHRPIDVVTIDPQQVVSPDAPETAFSSANRDEHGQSMLHFAAARTHARNALFQLLQESEISLGYRDELYRTARDVSIQANVPDNTAEIDKWVLHIAAKGNTEKIMGLLLEGYDHILDVVDEGGVPITEVVSQRGDAEMSKLLTSIPTFEESRDKLHYAVRRGDLSAVQELVSAEGGRTLARSRNAFGRSALHVAVLAQHEDIVAYLAQTCPELLRIGDNLERTPLHYAMGVEKIESLSRILIRAGSKRVLKDLKGRQPSYYFMNKSDILRLKEEEEVY